MAGFGTFVDDVSLKASELNTFFATTSFSPQITQSNTVSMAGQAQGHYFRVNKVVVCTVNALCASTGTGGNRIELTLPVTASSSSVRTIGYGYLFDFSGVGVRLMRAVQFSTTRAAFLTGNATSLTSYAGLTNGPAFTVGDNDRFFCVLQYEAA